MNNETARYLISAFSLFVLLLCGCSTPFKKPQLEPEESRFTGISNLLDSNEIVDVVSIHGMCTHDVKWVNETVRRLDSNLVNLQFRSTDHTQIEGVDIYTSSFDNADGEVRLKNHALVWSGLTNSFKKKLCFDSSIKTPNCQKDEELNNRTRASINSALKSSLMNDCLSDVVIYLGSAGPKIRDAIRASIDEIVRKSATKDFPLILISESLGSKILADALIEDAKDKQARLEYFASTQTVFMAANQIPLLEILAADSDKDGYPDSSFDKLLTEISGIKTASRQKAVDSGAPIQVVAFTDPNDLLSYEIQNMRVPVTNALVSNDKTWFGALERPDTAHTGYLDNGSVWRLIVCGNTAECLSAK